MDEFSMLRVIGRGSYAKVLLVEQKRSKRIYAMKVIKKELVNDDEVRLIESITHGDDREMSFETLDFLSRTTHSRIKMSPTRVVNSFKC